jgi:hypothetical protein
MGGGIKMKIGLALLCAGTVMFMLRVLIALLAETTNRSNLPTKVYMAKFKPKSKPSIRPRDLIIMKSNENMQKPPTRKATGTALVLTAALLLALSAPRPSSTTDHVLVKQDGAMKQGIEELAAQLANNKSQEQPASDTQAPLRPVDPSPATATLAAARRSDLRLLTGLS